MAKTRKIVKKKLNLPIPSAQRLLDWYDQFGRDLPWRSHAGRAASPYHTWIAEIMLQQTTVAAVIPYYGKFLTRWPSVIDLAKADEQEVLAMWAGLGYYSRARNLLKCAQTVAQNHQGRFPETIAELKALPGIGDYTANAIRAIAFDQPANVVDGNVERVMARVYVFAKPLNTPQNKKEIAQLAAQTAPESRPGDYAQALMDLGATICTPKTPKCLVCPWNTSCCAYALNQQDQFPVRVKKQAVPQRYATTLVTQNDQDQFFLVRRPASGLLGGLWEFPSTDWLPQPPSDDVIVKTLGHPKSQFDLLNAPVTHGFTHLKLIVQIAVNRGRKVAPVWQKRADTGWYSPDAMPPLSTLTKKILNVACKTLGDAGETR